MKTQKTYTIKQTLYGLGKTRETEKTGTLEELVKHFKYTLEVGNSYNSSIKTNPKTIKSLISNLNKALKEKYNYPAIAKVVE